MIKCVIDVMGSDEGSNVFVSAIKDYLKVNSDIEIIACGKKEELKELDGLCQIVDAQEVVKMDASPLEVLRNKNSSMMKAIETFTNDNCDAIVSAGGTGAFLSSTTVKLKLIPGIKRAALVAPFPTKIKGKKAVLLDIGANNENSSEELKQFAAMGRLYAQSVYNIENPKTYLLSNGTEEHKGSPVVQETHKLLKEDNFPNFMGNIEARDALDGSADVVVMDGFTGNTFLKSTEGTAKWISSLINKAFKKNIFTMIGYLFVRGGVKNIKDTFDYKSTGGAMLLGVNGVVVKAHGNSDSFSIFSAIDVAYKLARNKIIVKIKDGVK